MSVEIKSEAEQLAALVRAFAGRRVLVVGDLIADQFVSGEISRVSREAPVMILRHERTETVPGGAANCAMNLAALCARAAIVGVAPGRGTTTKVRILAGHAHSTRQQVVRLDYESEPLKDGGVLADIASNV